METLTRCPFCGSRNISDITKIRDYTSVDSRRYIYSACQNCGVIFQSFRPEASEIKNFYQSDYQPYNDQYNFFVKKFIEYRTRREIRIFKKLNPNIANVLEIGCSFGRYLKALRDFGGFNVTGIEIDGDCCRRGKAEFNLEIINSDLLAAGFKPESFDLIVMNHVLEHLYNPAEVLAEISKVLRSGGILSIKTPNADTLERKFFKNFWFPYEAPRHIFLFSPETLKKILSASGLSVKEISFEKTPNNLILSVRNYLIEKNYSTGAINFFNINNYLLLALFLPLAAIFGLVKKSGRMVIIAQKNE